MAKLADVPVSSQNGPLTSALAKPGRFLQPSLRIYSTSRDSAKRYFDLLAKSVSDSQTTRQKIARKRKRSEVAEGFSEQALQVKQLYTNGFSPEQIWEQALRILESAGAEIERDLALTARNHKARRVGADLQSVHASADSDDADSVASSDWPDEASDALQSTADDGGEGDFDESDGEDQQLIGSEDEDDADGTSSEQDDGEVFTQDPFGLNDGFFSIDEFNRQSEAFERQDARRDSDEEDSDDEEIDWHANPLTAGQASLVSGKASSRGKPDGSRDTEGTDGDSEDDGPTFGNANLDDPSDSSGDEAGSLHGGNTADWMNTNDIKYEDFFAPPAKKIQSKKFRALPKTQPDESTMENDMERAMADVRRDLFDDEVSNDEASSANEDGDDAGAPRSAHEKRRARIADEIRRLEAANVAKKEWVLAGEAKATERPINSLIEEDLDFERVGKPVPVVTNETSQDIEDLVKRRIIAREFDEVIRRRPGVSDLPGHQKGRVELDDSKPQQSLAELYEADHLRANDPNYVDAKSQKLSKEHADIANLWKDVSAQLDTLSNWHYKPKAPQASINVVTDVATITMEDARPAVSGSVDGQGALAPQEIYAPGDDGKVSGEVLLKSGVSVAKEEMTREDKARRRRQHKQRTSNRTGPAATPGKPGKDAQKQQLVSQLQKAGVKVIGKQGEISDMHGRKPGEQGAKTGADTLKL